MKQFFSRIFALFYFWKLKNGSYYRKRKKVIRRNNAKNKIIKAITTTKKIDFLVFKDEKGVICFSIQKESLHYIESDTNYITIYYSDQGKLEKYFMRSSLKMVLKDNPDANLVRCHRSYIINFKNVKVFKKDKEGGCLVLTDPLVPPIPVSKSYIDNVLCKFQL